MKLCRINHRGMVFFETQCIFKRLCIFGPKGAIQIRYYYYYFYYYYSTSKPTDSRVNEPTLWKLWINLISV